MSSEEICHLTTVLFPLSHSITTQRICKSYEYHRLNCMIEWLVLRSDMGMTHVFRQRFVMGCTNYTQKSTRFILALKISVAQPLYLWVTATVRTRLMFLSECWSLFPAIIMSFSSRTRQGEVQNIQSGFSSFMHYSNTSKPQWQ